MGRVVRKVNAPGYCGDYQFHFSLVQISCFPEGYGVVLNTKDEGTAEWAIGSRIARASGILQSRSLFMRVILPDSVIQGDVR